MEEKWKSIHFTNPLDQVDQSVNELVDNITEEFDDDFFKANEYRPAVGKTDAAEGEAMDPEPALTSDGMDAGACALPTESSDGTRKLSLRSLKQITFLVIIFILFLLEIFFIYHLVNMGSAHT